jgi:hypothetical protein
MEVTGLGDDLETGLQSFDPRPSGGADLQALEDHSHQAPGAEVAARFQLHTQLHVREFPYVFRYNTCNVLLKKVSTTSQG